MNADFIRGKNHGLQMASATLRNQADNYEHAATTRGRMSVDRHRLQQMASLLRGQAQVIDEQVVAQPVQVPEARQPAQVAEKGIDWQKAAFDEHALRTLRESELADCRERIANQRSELRRQTQVAEPVRQAVGGELPFDPIGYMRKQDGLEYAPCWMTYAVKPAPENGGEPAALYSEDQVRHMLAPQQAGEGGIMREDPLPSGMTGNSAQRWLELTPTNRPEPEVFVLAWDGKKVSIDWFGSLLRPNGTEYTHWFPFPAPPGQDGNRSMYGMKSVAAPPPASAGQRERGGGGVDRAPRTSKDQRCRMCHGADVQGKAWELEQTSLRALRGCSQ